MAQPVQAVTQQAGDQATAYSASFAGGGHVVVWNSVDPNDTLNSTVYAQVYDPQGRALGNPIRLFTEVNAIGDVLLVAGGVTTLGDGSFAVSARSQRPNDVSMPRDWVVWTERLGAGGEELVPPVEVARLSSFDDVSLGTGPVLPSPDGASYYVQTNTVGRPIPYIFFASSLERLDLAGSPLGNPIRWSTLDRSGSDAVVLAGGNELVVNTNTGPFGNALSLTLTAYDPGGNSAGTSTSGALGGTSTAGSGARLAALAGGNAILVWRQEVQDGSTKWFSQLVGPNAQLLGVPQQLTVDLGSTEMISLATGGALAWWDSGSGFVARYIDSSGQFSGETFPIGSNVISVSATPDGGFLVESVQENSATGKDVYEQKFARANG